MKGNEESECFRQGDRKPKAKEWERRGLFKKQNEGLRDQNPSGVRESGSPYKENTASAPWYFAF